MESLIKLMSCQSSLQGLLVGCSGGGVHGHLKQHGGHAELLVAHTHTRVHTHTHAARILPPFFSAHHLPPPPAICLYPCVSHTRTPTSNLLCSSHPANSSLTFHNGHTSHPVFCPQPILYSATISLSLSLTIPHSPLSTVVPLTKHFPECPSAYCCVFFSQCRGEVASFLPSWPRFVFERKNKTKLPAEGDQTAAANRGTLQRNGQCCWR